MRPIIFTLLLAVFPFISGALDDDAVFPRRVHPYVVIDGDTFVTAGDSRVYRLYGVDAPEIDQRWGAVARLALSELIHKRAVTLVSRHGETYGRPVVVVTVRGRDVGLELIRMGLAWHAAKYAPERRDYAAAEAEARKSGRGLWSDPVPESPWEFRAERRYTIIDEE